MEDILAVAERARVMRETVKDAIQLADWLIQNHGANPADRVTIAEEISDFVTFRILQSDGHMLTPLAWQMKNQQARNIMNES